MTAQGDAGVACPCGGRMLYRVPGDPAAGVACPRCGKTPLDLVRQREPDERPPMTVTADARHVWLAFHGTYEDRSPFAAFTTEDLAKQHSDDVEAILCLDRPVRTCEHHTRWLRFEQDRWTDEHEPRADVWPEWVGPEWDKPVSRSDIHYYPAVPDSRSYVVPFTWLIVEGADLDAVRAEVARRKPEAETVHRNGGTDHVAIIEEPPQ